ncbi:MAG: galactokinase family protein [Candidatus Aminicenantes bacterium]
MKIKSSAPGRICLFGEHQDYLGFPVIAAAVDLRITITGEVSPGDTILIDLPDIGKKLQFNSNEIVYKSKKDYLQSAVNVLKKKKLYTPKAIKAVLKGNIPIQAGTSSSAALSVAWTGFLLEASETTRIADYRNNLSAIAELAYMAEVEEFDESGGRMDQYTSALGGIVYLDFFQKMTVTSLPPVVKEFVLGDSMEPKDTQKTLKRVRTAQEEAFTHLAEQLKFKDNFHLTYEEAKPFLDKIPTDCKFYLEAALINHQITVQAKEELLKETPDIKRIASLMNRHQELMRNNLRVSTPKLDAMIDKTLKAGALAAKINGSGEGGCMFAFCPGKQREVAEAIKRAGGMPYIINIGKGLEVRTDDSK